ncbi:MAG TPA: hypothetical protein VJN92_21470 [Candidatus Acidoferrum sp.]|nr:hypothetical protein [Candidatus Acidoferrum sp.]
MKKLATLTLSLFLTAGIALADTPKDADPKPANATSPAKPKAAKKAEKLVKSDSAIAAEIEELRQAIQSQQEQLQLLKEEVAKRDRQIDEAREAAAAANARATEASTKAVEAVNSSAEVKTTAATLDTAVGDLKASNEVLKTTVATEQAEAKKATEEGPASIHIKGITLTPGGFLAAETVWRQRTVQADVNTPFTTAPFPNSNMSRVSEFNASGRQSRLTFLAEGKADNVKMSGYYELDWLGACASSNSRQSNSYCMRQRQIWGQAAFSNGVTLTGGQMWSLATETRKGLDNRTEATPMTIDAAYNVGFTWARQYGFRVTKNFNDKIWIGFSVENPQLTLTTHGSPTSFFVGAPASGGGLLNATDGTGYAANATPDFIVKAAFEPGRGHYEVFGVISNYRARVYPCFVSAGNPLPASCGAAPSAAGAFNDTRTGGGGGVNIRLPLDPRKKIELGVHGTFGAGIGRDNDAQIADVTTRPDGTLALIRGGGGLGTIELHPTPKLDVYLNYGAEFSYRTAYTFTNNAGATVPVGFGSPLFNNSSCEVGEANPGTGGFGGNTTNGTCTGDLRNIQEGTIGFWHKPYQGSKGGLRWGIQYSYLVRNGWSGSGGLAAGTPGVSPKAVENMVFTSFRYYLP